MLALALLALASAAPAQDLSERLRADADLGRLTWAHAGEGHLEVALQTLGAQPPVDQATALARDLAPRLDALTAVWAAWAAALELPPDLLAPPLPAVVVLGDERAHAAWLAARVPRAPFADLAVHERELAAVVTRVFPGAALAPERRIAILRATAGAWLDRAARSGALEPSALREGLAGHLARAADEGGERAPFARADAARLVEAARESGRRLQTLPELADLWRPADAPAAREWLYERARDLGLAGARSEEAQECFYAQARAWCDWLGSDARRAAPWRTYLRGALEGRSGAEDLAAALGVDRSELEREFLDVLLTAGARDVPLDLLAQIESERAVARATARQARNAGPDFHPRVLAPSALDARVQLALALGEARDGALAAALARLDEVLLVVAGTPEGERATRERGRLAALQSARSAWAQAAAAAGGRLTREVDGKRTALKVERFEDGVLHFARNRLEIDSLPLEAVAPAEVLGDIDALPAGTPAWVSAWARCLAGDARWSRGSEGLPEFAPLEADARELPALLELGATAVHLQRLSEVEVDGGALVPERAEEVLRELTALLQRPSDPRVEAARAELAALADLALGARHDALGGIPGLAGAVSAGPAGSVRVRYTFDAAGESEDFVLDRAAMADWHATMTSVPKSAEESYFVQRQGAFFGDGQLVYRHRMRFRAPVRVRYVMRYVPRPGDPLDVGVVLWGLGGTDQGTFAAASEFGDVYVTDPGTGHGAKRLFEGERVVEINTLYTCEARLEAEGGGFTIEAWREGALRNALPAPNCDGGDLFLFVHTPRIVALEEVTIEGVPDPAALSELRAAWIARERAALGL